MVERSIPPERKGNDVESDSMKVVGRQLIPVRPKMVVDDWGVNYPERASGSYRFVNLPVKSDLV